MKKFPLMLPLWLAYLLTALSSVFITLFLFYIQPNAFTTVCDLIIKSGGLTFLLNWIPVLFTAHFLFYLTARLPLAAGLTAIIFTLPAVVNRFMIAMRHEPLQPLHLLLGAEFMGIAKSLRPEIFILVGVGILLCVLLIVATVKLIKNEKPSKVARISGAVIHVALGITLFLTVYTGQSFYDSLPLLGNRYSETEQFNSKGFVYSFIHSFTASRFAYPDYYGDYEALIEDAERKADTNSAAPNPSKVFPNIVIVQSEAFSELPLGAAINYEGFDDPLANYKKVKDESVSGYAIAPHVGGGTSDMEFDVLTGLNTRSFRGVPYTFNLIRNSFPSVASVLKEEGYAAIAMHPGAGWFYNRQNVYPFLGFDKFIDDKSYDITDTKGMYITEKQTMERMLEEYEARPSPKFIFNITIQNHGPYFGKYPIDGVNYNTELELSPEDSMSLANYIEGVKDCDRELKTLVDYFSASSEPVLLLYYGDHLPSFTPELLNGLDPLPGGASETEAAIHNNRVPFLIWQNAAAKKITDTTEFENSLPENKNVSAFYIGAAILEMAGITGDPFFDYVNGMRGDYPVVLAEMQDARLQMYDSWGYYIIRNRKLTK